MIQIFPPKFGFGFRTYKKKKITSHQVSQRYFLNIISEDTVAMTKSSIFLPAGIYLLKVNNRNTRTRYEICSKLTINTPERRHWRRSGVFIVNFEHISHLVPVFLLLTLNK